MSFSSYTCREQSNPVVIFLSRRMIMVMSSMRRYFLKLGLCVGAAILISSISLWTHRSTFLYDVLPIPRRHGHISKKHNVYPRNEVLPDLRSKNVAVFPAYKTVPGHSDCVAPNPFCPNILSRTKRKHFLYEDHVPERLTWNSSLDITNASYTTFSIVKPGREKFTHFVVCDTLEILIQARNGRNESKSHGGDFFRAKIFTQNSTFAASSSTDGEILDHGDGAYSGWFTLKWSGLIQIEVTLVHSSEAVYVLRKFQNDEEILTSFIGQFHAGDPQVTEYTSCNMRLSEPLNKTCNFTDVSTGSPWFCVKPENFSCSDWQAHRSGGTLDAFITDLDRLPFKKNDQKITGTTSITVPFTSGNLSVVTSDPLERLPPCRPRMHFGQPEVAGFYWGTRWYSPHCRIKQFSRDTAAQALTDKSVYFFGDSTVRQIFEYYVDLFKLKTVPSRKNDQWYIGPTFAKHAKYNLSLLFHFHANPIGKRSLSKTSNIEYIANLIDNIDGSKDTVIILTMWAHFGGFPTWYYEERIRSVHESVKRLLARSPQSLVIWKSANTREHGGDLHYIKYSDWKARDMDRRLKNRLFDIENIAFLDAWDMTNAQFAKPNVHPKNPHVENLSQQILTFISNNIS